MLTSDGILTTSDMLHQHRESHEVTVILEAKASAPRAIGLS